MRESLFALAIVAGIILGAGIAWRQLALPAKNQPTPAQIQRQHAESRRAAADAGVSVPDRSAILPR